MKFGKNSLNLIMFELLPFFDILDIANTISRKVKVLEARNL